MPTSKVSRGEGARYGGLVGSAGSLPAQLRALAVGYLFFPHYRYGDPLDPQWNTDEGMKRYKAFMGKFAPAEDANSGIATYGYSTAALLIHILKQCDDDLTRANIMKQSTNIKDYAADLALPGMTTSTEPDDWRINKQFQMMKFDGQRWVLFGPILTDEFKTN